MRLKQLALLFFVVLVVTVSYGQEFQAIQKLVSTGHEDQALDQLATVKDKNDITYLNLMGEAYLHKGLYKEALKNLEKAAYLQEQNSNHNEGQLAKTYSFTALVHWTTGNDQLALQYHFKALDIRTQLNDKAGIAASTNDIGLVYSRSNPNKAIEYYKKALADYRELYGNIDGRIVTAYANIGVAYRNLKQFDQALKNLEKALEIRQQLGRGSNQEAFLYSAIGTVYSAQKELDQALQQFELALGIYQRNYGNKHPEIASTHNLIGNTLYAQGDFKGALQHYQEAIIANSVDFHSPDIYTNPKPENYYNADVLLRTLFQKAKAFEDLHNSFSLKFKDLEMAYVTIGLADQLIDKIRQFRTSESDKVALGNLAADIYEAAIRISINMSEIRWQRAEYFEKAFYYTDKSKSAVLLEAIADTNAKSYAGIPDDLLEQERLFKAEVNYYEQKLAGKPTPEEEVEYRKQLFDWTKNYNDLIASLEELYPTYFNLKHNAKIPTVAEIQEKLTDNAALLSYFVATNDSLVYAFVITKKLLKVHEIQLAENYDMNISGYRNAMYYDAPTTYRKTARALYEQLMPFRLPGNINKLIVIPSGRMATIPFEALITKPIKPDVNFAELPYLINNYFISYQYAASLYLNPHVEMAPNATISLFAPVEFKGRRLSALPGTEKEVKDISNLFAGSSDKVSLFIEDSATVDEVESKAVTQSKFLHFATHGIVDEKQPERSQICMASDKKHMGSLYSGDIYSLHLSADLVVLSACETGLGKISKGEGIIGLTRALIYAGSNNLVVSLWRVGDASTSVLMTDFYRSMLQGSSYAEALAYAKLGMIKSAEFSSPYYWAPFVLIGE